MGDDDGAEALRHMVAMKSRTVTQRKLRTVMKVRVRALRGFSVAIRTGWGCRTSGRTTVLRQTW